MSLDNYSYQQMIVDPKEILKNGVKSSLLYKFSEFKETIEYADRVVAYIALVYDRKSPLTDISDIDRRKSHAISLVGLDEDMFKDHINSLVNCKIPSINRMIVRYCVLCGGRLLALLIAAEQAYSDALEKLTNYETPSDGDELKDQKTRLDLIDSANSKEAVIEDIIRRIASNESRYEIVEAIPIMAQGIDLTVEDYARLWVKDKKGQWIAKRKSTKAE